jgi:hypothetical protein
MSAVEVKTGSVLATSALAVALVTLAGAHGRDPGAPAAAVKAKAKSQGIVLKENDEFHVHLVVENMADGDVPTEKQVTLENDWFTSIQHTAAPKPYKQGGANKGLIIRAKPQGKKKSLPPPPKVTPGQGPQKPRDGDNLTITISNFDPTETKVPAVVSD